MKSDEPDIFLHYNLCHYVHVKFDLEQYYFWRGFILDHSYYIIHSRDFIY